VLATLPLLALCNSASAHLSYAGRDFGTFTGLSLQSNTITGQTVPTNWGWADGTDPDFGHTHRVRFFKFTLENSASVTITFVSPDPSAMLPAFSLYSGLGSTSPPAYESDMTFAYLSTLPAPEKEGAFNALATWLMGTDTSTSFADFSTFTYVGNAADGRSANYGLADGINGDGLPDGSITGTFLLRAGSYTIVVGGANYSGQGSGASIGDGGQQGADILPDAIIATLTVIPEPTGISAGLAGGLFLLGTLRRRN
jgi:hypothetical protein